MGTANKPAPRRNGPARRCGATGLAIYLASVMGGASAAEGPSTGADLGSSPLVLVPLPEPAFPPRYQPLPEPLATAEETPLQVPEQEVLSEASDGPKGAAEPALTVASAEALPATTTNFAVTVTGADSFDWNSITSSTLGAHVASWHSSPGLNNVNPGLYVRLPVGFTAGVVRNSYDRNSTYVAWTVDKSWSLGRQWPLAIGVGLTTGIISGYEKGPPLRPLVAPSFVVNMGKGGIRLAALKGEDATAVHCMFEMTP